jgi:N-acetylmuramoyl-L-alanine amidase
MSFDLDVAARTLWMEVRGETVEGQKAVAHVLLNRVKDGRWGHSLTSVCLWAYQFSSWNTGDSNRKTMSFLSDNDPLLMKLQSLLTAAANEPDPTNGATHYYALWITEPVWVAGATFCGQFGKQKFYKDVR